MTSKELLEHIIFEAKLDKPIFSVYYQELIGAKEKIEKDLEILEIIKKWSFIEESYKEGYGPYTKFQCIIHTIGMEEDFNKIKEWLENE